MELKDYIISELNGLKRGMGRVLNGLGQQEIMWKPACGCNSVGLIIFHVARSEDMFVQARLQGKPELWETEKWFKKLNMAETEAGSHYTMDQVNAFPVPEMKDLMAYYDSVREKTMDYLKGLTPDAFDKKISIGPPFGEMAAATILSIVVSHSAQHMGEISYLRGLQRGMDK